jgi:hypothetical protein
MLHASFNYTGIVSSEHIVVEDDAAYQTTARFAKERLEHAFRIEALDQSSIEVFETASSMEIRGDSILRIPEWLHRCVKLKFLLLPVHLASQLQSDSLPRSIETIDFSGDGRAKISDQFVHGQVKRLMSDANAAVAFKPSSFPSLEYFHFLSDKKKRLLMELHKSNVRLVAATITPFSHPNDLNALFEGSLKYLRLGGGLANNLQGIERFAQITDLNLHNLSRLEKIEPILQLGRLQDLSIGYCNRIQDLEKIAKVRSLRRLLLYGCHQVISDAHIELFRGMKLDELVM